MLVNTDKGTYLWTKAGREKQFSRWVPFLLTETTAIDPGNVEIKAGPDAAAKTIRKAGPKDCFEAREIRGDWMRIRSNQQLDCDESGKPLKSG
ncbi:hypothetical protein [Flaviaesturariibacter terrae]